MYKGRLKWLLAIRNQLSPRWLRRQFMLHPAGSSASYQLHPGLTTRLPTPAPRQLLPPRALPSAGRRCHAWVIQPPPNEAVAAKQLVASAGGSGSRSHPRRGSGPFSMSDRPCLSCWVSATSRLCFSGSIAGTWKGRGWYKCLSRNPHPGQIFLAPTPGGLTLA